MYHDSWCMDDLDWLVWYSWKCISDFIGLDKEMCSCCVDVLLQIL
jgi:hypothetical protein